MSIAIQNDTLFLPAEMDENGKYDLMLQAIEKHKKENPNCTLLIDANKVNKITSIGIFHLSDIVAKYGAPFKYINTPWLLTQQMILVPDLLGKYGIVDSFKAPYFDSSTNEIFDKTFVVGKDIPVLKNYDDFFLPKETVCGAICTPDFNPDEDFLFISDCFERYPAQK